MAKKILIINDETKITRRLTAELEHEGYSVTVARSDHEGLRCIRDQKQDLVLLVHRPPLLNGYETCLKLRHITAATAVIMLSERHEDVDEHRSLVLRIDDHVVRPFRTREIVARVNALLGRRVTSANESDHVRIGNVEVDFRRFSVTRRGHPVSFTSSELQILRLLVRKRGNVVTRKEFLNEIWGRDAVAVSSRTIDSHIASIRKKLEDDPSHPSIIKNVRGVGYTMSLPKH